MGHKMLSRIRTVFAYAVAKGLLTVNPAESVKPLLPKCKGSNGHHKSIAHSRLGALLRAVEAGSREHQPSSG